MMRFIIDYRCKERTVEVCLEQRHTFISTVIDSLRLFVSVELGIQAPKYSFRVPTRKKKTNAEKKNKKKRTKVYVWRCSPKCAFQQSHMTQNAPECKVGGGVLATSLSAIKNTKPKPRG